jgi:hypothetical protein
MFKKAALLAVVLACSSLFAQGQIAPPKKTPAPATEQQRELIQKGVAQHDRRDYNAAIKFYDAVLAENPDNVDAIYELSFSYSMKKDYKKSLEIAYRGAEYKSDLLASFYMQIGNNLDILGDAKKAVEVYKSGLKLMPGKAMLYYNLAITHRNMGDVDDARKVIKEGLLLDPNHPGSHALLSLVWYAGGYKTPALLAGCRFLVLEPRFSRAVAQLQVVKEIMAGGVSRGADSNITILMDPSSKKDEGDFGALDLAMGLTRAAGMTEKNKGKTEMQLLVGQFQTFFAVLSEQSEKADRNKFVWKYYAPYFAEMKQKDQVEAFVYYIAQYDNKEAAKWLADNKARVDDFLAWSKSYKWPAAE